MRCWKSIVETAESYAKVCRDSLKRYAVGFSPFNAFQMRQHEYFSGEIT